MSPDDSVFSCFTGRFERWLREWNDSSISPDDNLMYGVNEKLFSFCHMIGALGLKVVILSIKVWTI